MTARALTIVLAYYRNAGMLQRHYALLGALPADMRAQLTLIVVDDGSPKGERAAPADIGLKLEIYRILQDVRWNQDAARNLGVDRSSTRWLLLTDMDHLIPGSTLMSLLYGGFDSAKAYKFSRVTIDASRRWPQSEPGGAPYKPHPNSWFMTRKLFDKVGGYDERFAGWYGTDADFRKRLEAVAPIEQLPAVLVRVPREVQPDASTTVYERKTEEDRLNIARIMAARERIRDWKPLRGSFEWERVA